MKYKRLGVRAARGRPSERSFRNLKHSITTAYYVDTKAMHGEEPKTHICLWRDKTLTPAYGLVQAQLLLDVNICRFHCTKMKGNKKRSVMHRKLDK